MDYEVLPEGQQLNFCPRVRDKRQITLDRDVAYALDIKRGDMVTIRIVGIKKAKELSGGPARN